MENILGVITLISLMSALRMLRGGLPGDRPLIVLALVIMGLAGHSWYTGEPITGVLAVIVALVVGIIPPYLSMASQLARVRGQTRLSLWLETGAVILRPGAVRRLHFHVTYTVYLVQRGRLSISEGIERLAKAEPLLGDRGASTAVEGTFWLHAAKEDWGGLLDRFEGVAAKDSTAVTGLSFGALSLIVEAYAKTKREAPYGIGPVQIVEHMHLAADGKVAHTRSIGESGELPDAYIGRASVFCLAYLGGDPSGLLGRRTALRPLFTKAELAQYSDAKGRTYDEEDIERLQAELAVQKALPSFLASFRAPTRASAGLAFMSGVILLAVMATGSSIDPSYLLRCGGCLADRVVNAGEWWRLFTSMFLHAGPVHFLVNALFLIQVGNLAERLMGPWRFLAVYLFSGVVGSVTAVALGQPAVMVGASGAISGIFGAGAVMVFASRRRMPLRWVRRNMSAFTFTFLANLFLGLAIPMVSLSAHGGGFVAGILLTAILVPLTRIPKVLRDIGKVAVVVLWIAAFALGISGVRQSFNMDLSKLIPVRQAHATLTLERGQTASVTIAHPGTWAKISRKELPNSPPAWVGSQGQLFYIDAACGPMQVDIGDGQSLHVEPGDSETLMELLKAANAEADGIEFLGGPNGWVLANRPEPDGAVMVQARKVFETGMLQLGFRFEAGTNELQLLDTLLEQSALDECVAR